MVLKEFKGLCLQRWDRFLCSISSLPSWLTIPFWTLALYMTTQDAARALIASGDLWVRHKWGAILAEHQPAIDQQRAIQGHYLSYGVYIPIDDIVVNAQQQASAISPTLLQTACGEGRVYIWVSLPFKLPIIGEKVIEWCLVKA